MHYYLPMLVWKGWFGFYCFAISQTCSNFINIVWKNLVLYSLFLVFKIFCPLRLWLTKDINQVELLVCYDLWKWPPFSYFEWSTLYFLSFYVCASLPQTWYMLFHHAALNEALKKEVERLKMATGEMLTPTDTYNLGMHHISYSQSSFFSNQPQSGLGDPRNIQMPQFNPFQSNLSPMHQPMLAAAHSHASSEMLQLDPVGRMQGLDISSRGSHLVKAEGPSISASESSNRFWYKCCSTHLIRPYLLIVHRLTLLTAEGTV